MDLYTKTSYQLARTLTLNYSTSFGQSSKLFSKDIRHHIYAIYGLVRVADEIVDTYKGKNATKLLKDLEFETTQALKTGFSPNPLVHAFATTAKRFDIKSDLIHPFFKSMHMDLESRDYKQKDYENYIYGSAEVIGLMCLKVFCNNPSLYKRLSSGAQALGSAYQKVNFLRDIKSDYEERKRVYFPEVTFETFDERQKEKIIVDIKKDFKKAKASITKLPNTSQKAVELSFAYYHELLKKLEKASADSIKQGRLRVSTPKKMQLLIKTRLTKGDH